MRIYFAHPISSYDTPEEAQIIKALQNDESAAITVVNPNDIPHKNKIDALRAQFNDKAPSEIMKYFVGEVCATCDACVILAFPNGKFSAGVVSEAQSFISRGREVMEVQIVNEGPFGNQNVRLTKLAALPADRCLDVEQTRATLKLYKKDYVSSGVPDNKNGAPGNKK